jgi:nitrite reductase (NADH) small subunit
MNETGVAVDETRVVLNETHWVRVTCVENLPLREGREVLVGGRSLAVFNLGHQFLAVDNQCPHKQGPLADGIVTGTSVVCPLHAWRVNLETGEVERPAAGLGRCVRAYPTRVEDGVVSVQLGAVHGATSGVTTVSSQSVASGACASGAGAAESTGEAA